MSLHRDIEHTGASDFANAMLEGGGDGVEVISSSDGDPLRLGTDFASGQYAANEAFLSFDTSGVGATPASATLSLGLITFPDDDLGNDLIVATYNWGATLETADWREPTELTALTELGRISYADLSLLSSGDYFDVDIDPAGIVVAGTTRFVVFAENEADPTVDPIGPNTSFVVDGDGGTNPPILTTDAPPAAPTVTNVVPDEGINIGGNTVTVSGTNFTGATDVDFGATPADSFEVDDATTITAVTPAHANGTVDVRVTTAGGTSAISAADEYTFSTVDPDPPGPDPVTIRVIELDGTAHTSSGLTGGALPLARCEQITRTRNEPSDAVIPFPKYEHTRDDVHVFADDSGTGDLHLVEVLRNGIVRFRGFAVVAEGDSGTGEITLHCKGIDWALDARFLDGQRTNELTNPSFETGDDTGWTSVGLTTDEVTSADAIRGTYSLHIGASTPLGDNYKEQTVSITGTGVGTFVTIVAYFKIATITFHAFDRRGLYVEARDTGVLKANDFYAIDEATPTGEWIRAKAHIAVPPFETWDINVRFYAVDSIRWDDAQMVAMQSVSTATITGNTYEAVDVSEIVELVLDHAQNPAVGKSDLGLTLDPDTVGVKQVKHIQWADHISWPDQMAEWLDRDDCFDYSIRNNLDGTNVLVMHVPAQGVDRRADVTLSFPDPTTPRPIVASFSLTEDGGSTITDDTELDDDTGDGPDREEGHYADASQVGGLTLQTVTAAPTKSEPNSLDPLAREKVKKARRPAQLLTITLNGAEEIDGTPVDELLGIGDAVTLDLDDGWIQVDGFGRISQIVEFPKDRRLEVTIPVAVP